MGLRVDAEAPDLDPSPKQDLFWVTSLQEKCATLYTNIYIYVYIYIHTLAKTG